jgi:ribosome-associated toxin RatA of RatAB toxin-antitoxin module
VYNASREFVEDSVPPAALLQAVWEVETYPEFVKGIKRVEVLVREDDRLEAEFTAGLAGLDFQYVLRCERDACEVRWKRIRGSFRDASGSMTHLGQGRFRYTQRLDPGFAVPSFAVRFVLEHSLPRLIREFRSRAAAHVQDAGPS